MKLRIATHNAHKLKEFLELFPQHEVCGLNDLGSFEIAETGTTFAENALIKALAVQARCPDDIILADDSGLEVDALNGAPGVYSARYANVVGSDQDAANRKKLLDALKNVENRSARFICVLALLKPGENPVLVEGTCEGTITLHEQGNNGFGYDAVFFVPELNKTMAELNIEEKNLVSHRFKAIAKLFTLNQNISFEV